MVFGRSPLKSPPSIINNSECTRIRARMTKDGGFRNPMKEVFPAGYLIGEGDLGMRGGRIHERVFEKMILKTKVFQLLHFVFDPNKHRLSQNDTQAVNLLQRLMNILFFGLMGHHHNRDRTIDLPSLLIHRRDANIILP